MEKGLKSNSSIDGAKDSAENWEHNHDLVAKRRLYDELKAKYDKLVKNSASVPKTVLISVRGGIAEVEACPEDVIVDLRDFDHPHIDEDAKEKNFTPEEIKASNESTSDSFKLIAMIETQLGDKKREDRTVLEKVLYETSLNILGKE